MSKGKGIAMKKSTSIMVLMLGLAASSANAGFLDSLSAVRDVVGSIGYTADTVSYAKNSTKEMSDNLGLIGKTKTVQESSQGGLRSGDVLVSKLATLKLYGDSGKNKFVTTLGKADALVFMGEEENGMIHVSSDKGEGWVQKPLVAVR